jgi:DNA mismatch repair protein MutS2
LRLREARHPLLEAQLRAVQRTPVPLDLDLGAARALVLTGPNAGGKTVAMKTVGLLALLHQSGVPVTARAESELPVFARVVADIGDEQSIESAESTFSSHVRHVVEAVRAAGPRTLVLVDELMAGTDPEEGAALATVVLRRLAALGATALVTTHLAALKLFAHTEPGVANAGMAFDSQSRTPLYRLEPGVPGSSNALATAARLGLDAELLDEARRERGESAGRLEAALAALHAERARFEAARESARAAEVEAQRIREEHAQELARLASKRRTAMADARREAADFLAQAKARIENTVRELRAAQASTDSIRAAHQELRTVEVELREQTGDAARPDAPSVTGEPPRVGDRVWVRALEREGILEEVDAGGRAQVRFGNVTLVVTASDLQRVGPPAAPGGTARPAPVGGYTAPDLPAVPTRLDLRGLERGAALSALEDFLDRLLLQGTHQGEIVHGKGTGALRRAVQEHLAKRADVEAFRLGEHHEGGTGVTIVTLR